MLSLPAQTVKIFNSSVSSVTIVQQGQNVMFPIIKNASNDFFTIGFDILSPIHHRIRYEVHYLDQNFDKASDVFESEAVDLAGLQEIEDISTTTESTIKYTHYQLDFPNLNVRPLLSGNYAITFYVEDEVEGTLKYGAKLFTLYFGVLKRCCDIRFNIFGNSCVDTYLAHQQVNLNVHFTTPMQLSDKIVMVVVQNNNWFSAVKNLLPNYKKQDVWMWKDLPQLAFNAGNEFRSFELYSTEYPERGVERIIYDRSKNNFTAILLEDEPKKNYVYVQDKDGLYYNPKLLAQNGDTESDYFNVLFRLKMPYLPKQKIYVVGDFSQYQFLPMYQMSYDTINHQYQALLLLKAGYYNYQYLSFDDKILSSKIVTVKNVDGDFYATQNTYTAYIYKQSISQRGWQLIGYGKVKTKFN